MAQNDTIGIIREAVAVVREQGIAASVSLHHENSHLMRIGNNSVSLNTSEELTRLDIEVVSGSRKATHTHLGEVTSLEDLVGIIDAVAAKAGLSAQMDYTPVIPAVEHEIDDTGRYDPALANPDPDEKVEVYREIIAKAGDGYNYSGSWSSGSTDVFMATTSTPFAARHRVTDQQFTCVLKHPVKKWELAHWQTGWRAGCVSASPTLESFRELLPLYEKRPGFRAEPGSYKVVFGSQALAELVEMAVWTGCAGRTWEMKMGWTSANQPGDSILHPSITVHDDPSHPDVFGNPLSDSGASTKKLPLILNGKLAALAYDRNTAAKYGKKPTPNAGCLSMEPGSGIEGFPEVCRNIDRALYIPAIHYMNLPNMSRGIFTGSSRFSAVLVERGEAAAPLFSTRITDSFSRIFGNVLEIAAETVSVNTSNTYGRRNPSSVSVPSWILVDDVKVTDCAESF